MYQPYFIYQVTYTTPVSALVVCCYPGDADNIIELGVHHIECKTREELAKRIAEYLPYFGTWACGEKPFEMDSLGISNHLNALKDAGWNVYTIGEK